MIIVTPIKTLRRIAGSFGAALLALLTIVVGGHFAVAQSQDPLSLKRTNPGYDAAKSTKILSEEFAGAWRVTFAPEDKVYGSKKREPALTGRAVVAADGSGVTLTLKGPDGDESYESVETDAVRFAPGTGPFRSLLTVRFKRIKAPSAGDVGAGASAGKRLALPRSQNTASFVLADRPANDRDGRTCTSQLNLSSKVAGKNRDRVPDNVQPGQSGATKKAVEPNPEDCAAPSLKLPVLWRDTERERLRVQIATRADPDRYEGTWTEELNKSFAGGGRTVWVRGDPAIAGVIVLDDQTQLAYPFKPDGNPVKGAVRTRQLVIYGKHLPPLETEDGKPVRIESGDKSVHYVLLHPSPAEKRRLLGKAREIAKAATESAKRNAGTKKQAPIRTETVVRPGGKPAAKDVSPPERALDALKDGDAYFATAYLRKGVTSGSKNLSIIGAAADWSLLFGDQTALLHFTRHDDLARNDGVTTFFPGDIGAVDVIFDTDIPHPQIYVELLVRHPDAEQPEQPRVLLAQRREGEDPYYRTEPIHFVDADDATKRPPDDPKAVSLIVKKGTKVGARLIDAKQARAVPPLTTATVDSDPGALGPLWEEALKRVAACEGDVWQGDPKYALKTSEKISKVTVGDFLIKVASYTSPLARAAAELQGYDTSGPTRFDASTTLFVGDHAAALLIRDELVKALWRIQPGIKKVALGEIDTRGFRSMARRSAGTAGDPFWQDSVVTYVKKRVPWSFKNLFSGDLIRSMSEQSTVKLRLVETLDEAAIAKRFGIDRAEARKWAEKATREAAGDLYAKVDSAIARASGNSCDLAELLVVAGQNPDPFVARLLPRLVKRKGVPGPPRVVKGKKVPGPPARQYWVADKLARGFVERLGTGAKTVRAIEKYAAVDDKYKAMGVALATAGAGAVLTAGGYAGAGLAAALAGDIVDAAYFGVKDIDRYHRGEENYEYAQGISPVLGRDVLLTAEAQRENPALTAIGVLLPSLGAASNMAKLRHLKQLEHLNTINKGKQVYDTKGAKGLGNYDTLPESEKTALAAYYNDLVKKAQTSGTSSLDEGERAALDKFNELVSQRGGKPPQLPSEPARTPDQLAGSQPGTIIDRPASQSGTGTIIDRPAGATPGAVGRPTESGKAFDAFVERALGPGRPGEVPMLVTRGRWESLTPVQRQMARDAFGRMRQGDPLGDPQKQLKRAVNYAREQNSANDVMVRMALDDPDFRSLDRLAKGAGVTPQRMRQMLDEKMRTLHPNKQLLVDSEGLLRTGPRNPLTRDRSLLERQMMELNPSADRRAAAADARIRAARDVREGLDTGESLAGHAHHNEVPADEFLKRTGQSAAEGERNLANYLRRRGLGQAEAQQAAADYFRRSGGSRPAGGSGPDAGGGRPPAPPKDGPDTASGPSAGDSQGVKEATQSGPPQVDELRPEDIGVPRRETPEEIVGRLQKKRNLTPAEEVQLWQARMAQRGARDAAERQKILAALTKRQQAAGEFDLRQTENAIARPQRHLNQGSVPRRRVVAGDDAYIGNIMRGTGFRRTQRKVWASTINEYVDDILHGKPFPRGRDGQPIKIATDGSIQNGHHRLIAAQIVSNLTGRPLTNGSNAIIPPQNIVEGVAPKSGARIWESLGVEP